MYFLNYSPFEPTKVTNFENLEFYIYITQFLTSNKICFITLTFYLIFYMYFFLNLTLHSILLQYLIKIYEFVYDITFDYLHKELNYYFSFLLYIFWLILSANLVGMIPLAFSFTSHLSSTLSCAMFIWFSVITNGFAKNSLVFFKIILPKGIPYVLVPFLILVEFISYIFRVVSLSLRLFANVLAGHILLHVVSGFIYFIATNSKFGLTLFISFTSTYLLILLCVLFFFELMVSILQSYIFIVLSLIYLQDINNLNH